MPERALEELRVDVRDGNERSGAEGEQFRDDYQPKQSQRWPSVYMC